MDVDERLLRDPLTAAAVAFAYLFGSRAARSARAGSDLDLAIMPGRELGLLDEQGLASAIARVLEVPEIDLVRLDRAGLELRGRVVQEGRLVFSADEPRRVAFEVRTRSEYLDYLPTLRAHSRRYIRQVAERGL